MAIRIAVVGMGCRGRDWVREVKAAGPAFELAACVDVDSEALKTVAGVQCFTRLEEALESSACEAVIVATPAETHAAACEA
ncbi:MAG TPA: Gfo/Idh/MocA family oxidoreductase, partial [Pyrinomonadaceae bacterium]|nr:Gfo/Idh/MocA family oxidoreductase [Pyrinomonadaceae bacterium]